MSLSDITLYFLNIFLSTRVHSFQNCLGKFLSHFKSLFLYTVLCTENTLGFYTLNRLIASNKELNLNLREALSILENTYICIPNLNTYIYFIKNTVPKLGSFVTFKQIKHSCTKA